MTAHLLPDGSSARAVLQLLSIRTCQWPAIYRAHPSTVVSHRLGAYAVTSCRTRPGSYESLFAVIRPPEKPKPTIPFRRTRNKQLQNQVLVGEVSGLSPSGPTSGQGPHRYRAARYYLLGF